MTQALKGDIESWTLASDQKLLEALKQFSTSFTDQAKSSIKKVDNLSFDVSASETSLRNAFNEFIMLGNSQFMENVSI